jgi:hypothetical protein
MSAITRRRTVRGWMTMAILLWTVVARAAEPVGSVAVLAGHAQALHAGTSDWVDLASGDPVFVGDRLRTLADGKMQLAFREDSLLTLAASSELTVTQQVVERAAPRSHFSLLLGTLRAVVTERYSAPDARFEVESPTAVAAVRGTGFILTYDAGTDETTVAGLFDHTRVRSIADPTGRHEVVVGPGEQTRVPRGSLPVRPTLVPPNALRGLDAATTVLPEPGARRGGARGGAAEGAAQSGASPTAKGVDQPVELLKQRRNRRQPPPPPVPPRR